MLPSVENALNELFAPATFLKDPQLYLAESGKSTIVTAPGATATVCVKVGEFTGYSTVTFVATLLVRCNCTLPVLPL